VHYRIPEPAEFEPASDELLGRLAGFYGKGGTIYIGLLGIEIDEVRKGYSRCRLPIRTELMNAAGVVNGGALASLLDFGPVPALTACFETRQPMSTLDLHVRYHGAAKDEDLVGTAWVNELRRTVAFTQAAVTTEAGRLIATASHVFKVG